MPYPAEIVLKRIRERHKEVLIRPIDFVAAPDATVVSEAYKRIELAYQTHIDAMMHEPTFLEKLKQVLVPAGAVTATIVAPLIALPSTSSTSVAALSAAMATATFDLIYEQMNKQGSGQHYLEQLKLKLNGNNAYSVLVRKAFDNMAEDMLRAFCLRELRLKDSHNEETRKQVNTDYLTFLVTMLNQNITTIYGVHQADIEADANQWWLWKLLEHYFRNQEERKTTTQEIQFGLLKFVGQFHHDLAEEKTWMGKYPFHFAGYSAVLGAALGILATAFVPSLVVLFWPVIAATIGSGMLFAAGSYLYAKLAPYKRSREERQINLKLENEVLEGEAALKARLLQASSLNAADIQLLQGYKSSVENGYWSYNYVAIGSPSSWLRTFARHYAHSKMVENDFAPTILALTRRADDQVSQLITAIRESSGNGQLAPYLANYMRETRQYLLQAQGISVQKKYELVEKTKEQLLEAISKVGNIVLTPSLNDFFRELYGNDDQLELAQKFCPTSISSADNPRNVTCYNAMLEKANALIDVLRNQPVFVGSDDYWRALGIAPLEQTEITQANIDNLLNASKQFLRQISSPVERGNETEAIHSEAYYLYRTLLMRQFARLIFERKVDDVCIGKIKLFIEQTLHATKIDMAANVDDVLADVYYHDIDKPTEEDIAADNRQIEAYPTAMVKNVEYVASAMRIDLAYHPIVFPCERLEQCIHEFKDANGDILVLGDTRHEVLAHFNFDSSATILEDIKAFCANSRTLSDRLKVAPIVEDTWNRSPIELHYAYKDVLTRQTLFTLKSLLQSLARCHPEDVRITELRKAFIEMHKFLSTDCFELDDSLSAKQYLLTMYNKCIDQSVTPKSLLYVAGLHNTSFKLNAICEGDIKVTIPAPTDIQRNLKLSRTTAVEVAPDTILLSYTPGRDAQPPEVLQQQQVLAHLSIHSKLVGYFSSFLAAPVKLKAVDTQFEQHKATITKPAYSSYFNTSGSNIAKGTPEAWQRILDSGLVSAGEDGAFVLQLQEEARIQTEQLTQDLIVSNGYQIPARLRSYIEETSNFLSSPRASDSVEKYRFIEQAKAQLLTAISASRIESIPGQLLSFITETLGGNTDQVFLAQHFCPSEPIVNGGETRHTSYHPLLKKASQLAEVINWENKNGNICFVGANEYWDMLGQRDLPLQAPINKDTVSSLLNNSKMLLRKLGNPVEWGDTKECEYTEAYYLYRTLLMRQFAVLIHDKCIDEVSIQQIRDFVTNTLHANPDVILEDVFLYGRGLAAEPAHVAGAMQLNLAYHPAVSPIHLLDTCIEAYVTHSAKEPIVFGDPREKILDYLDPQHNSEFSTDINKFLDNTAALLRKLSQPPEVGDSWNESSVDLYYAYKHVVTQQTVYTLKAIMVSISRCSPEQGEQIANLRNAYTIVYNFMKNKENCYEINQDNDDVVTIDLYARCCTTRGITDAELIQQAKTRYTSINLKNIYKQEYNHAIQADPLFFSVQQNTVLGVVKEVDLTASMVQLAHKPGTDIAQILRERRAARAAESTNGVFRIYTFFTSMFISTPPESPDTAAGAQLNSFQ